MSMMTAPQVLVRRSLQLRSDAQLETDGGTALVCGQRRLGLGALPPAVTDVLAALAERPLSDSEVVTVAGGAGAGAALFSATMLLQRLESSGWLDVTLTADGIPVLRVRPHVVGARTPALVARAGQVALSRFAHVRRVGTELVLDSPEAVAGVVLHGGVALELLHALRAPVAADDPLPGVPVASQALRLLADAGLLTAYDGGTDVQESDPRWLPWSFHDLLFHSRSRAGRTSDGYGGTYRLAPQLPALPSVRRPVGETTRLARPDLASGPAGSALLHEIVESRRSIRAHDDEHPITVGQLGELLFRTLRERRLLANDVEEASDRPYPAGGAAYELEAYAVVGTVAGLDPGIYRYVPDAHELETVAPGSPAVASFSLRSGQTALMTGGPQVVLVLTGRFGRVMRKYESMPYALMLKHVGVVYQTLYLTATAMGLAPCGLGGGDSDAFAALSGRDVLEEASLGEFLLGSRPPVA